MATVFLNVLQSYFAKTQSARNQPDTLSLHIEYLRPTQLGPGKLHVTDNKLGRQTSTVHVTLEQNGQVKAVAYAVQTNFDQMTGTSLETQRHESRADSVWKGVSLPTKYSLEPGPKPCDLQKLRGGVDGSWKLHERFPYTKFNQAIAQINCHLPIAGQPSFSIADEWISFRSGETFTTTSLGFVADIWPSIGEAYRFERDPYDPNNPAPDDGSRDNSAFWYPTLNMTLEIKKRLPVSRVDLLFVRVRAREILKGRMDLEIHVCEPNGDLVALGKQVVLVVDAQRNWSKDKTPAKI